MRKNGLPLPMEKNHLALLFLNKGLLLGYGTVWYCLLCLRMCCVYMPGYVFMMKWENMVSKQWGKRGEIKTKNSASHKPHIECWQFMVASIQRLTFEATFYSRLHALGLPVRRANTLHHLLYLAIGFRTNYISRLVSLSNVGLLIDLHCYHPKASTRKPLPLLYFKYCERNPYLATKYKNIVCTGR
jgi:hypothetical protein